MNLKKEEFVHFVSSIKWLNNCCHWLHLINDQKDNPLIVPAFRFALVEYSKPYKCSHGVNKKFKLDDSCVPEALRILHKKILISRDQIHAHSDLTLAEAKLSLHESMGQEYHLIVENKVTGAEDLPKISEIIKLVEATLDNMYEKEKQLAKELRSV